MKLDQISQVMLIDDSQTDRFIHKKLLEIYKIGKEVIEESGARDGLNYLSENSDSPEKLPDLILLDVLMPEMNGFDFLNHLEKIYKDLAKKPLVFMLSSTDDEGDLKKARSISIVQKMLRKPFSPETLIAALSEL